MNVEALFVEIQKLELKENEFILFRFPIGTDFSSVADFFKYIRDILPKELLEKINAVAYIGDMEITVIKKEE